MKRRTFLASTSVLAIAMMARPWRLALASERLTDAHTTTLLRMVKDIFPHDMLNDDPYLAVVSQLKGAAADPDMSGMLVSGLAGLDAVSEGPWADRESGQRVSDLKAIEATPFFITVRVSALFGLYGNPEIWPAFGYEGASYEQGGYLFRGFDDLGWLPEPLS
jgi:hypothetical protein